MEVSLHEILDARERRAARQRQLLEKFHSPLICFTMNIAGPEKNSPLITRGFRYGCALLKAQLLGVSLPVLCEETEDADTGCEGYYVVDGQPETIKALCVQIEDSLPVGRLFDMDVLLGNGRKISREELGLPGRTCLICGGPVHLCSRSRAHSVSQLQEKTQCLLQDALFDQDARQIGQLAVKALLYEVCITPKPGLVDRQNTGSHKDMDIFTFMSSTAALGPYFSDCARIGMETATLSPRETFEQIRFRGRCAEQEMYQATGGINTHKGAIFSLGILCAAAGRVSDHLPENICTQAKAMCAGLTERDMSGNHCATTGEKLWKTQGISGARGQAEAGFPAVLEVGLPVLRQGLAQGLSLNEAGAVTLMHLIPATQDTNLYARSDAHTQAAVCQEIRKLLEANPFPTQEVLEEWDAKFIQKNLSPGGSADLLAASFFLYFLKEE